MSLNCRDEAAACSGMQRAGVCNVLTHSEECMEHHNVSLKTITLCDRISIRGFPSNLHLKTNVSIDTEFKKIALYIRFRYLQIIPV